MTHARDPQGLALVDGEVRLSYAEWLTRISSLVGAFDRIGLKPGDHLLTALQNTWQAATLHWACQLAGLIVTPVNWRVKVDELDFCIENSNSRYASLASALLGPLRKHSTPMA
jgi:2-furoate---CoA ligase